MHGCACVRGVAGTGGICESRFRAPYGSLSQTETNTMLRSVYVVLNSSACMEFFQNMPLTYSCAQLSEQTFVDMRKFFDTRVAIKTAKIAQKLRKESPGCVYQIERFSIYIPEQSNRIGMHDLVCPAVTLSNGTLPQQNLSLFPSKAKGV